MYFSRSFHLFLFHLTFLIFVFSYVIKNPPLFIIKHITIAIYFYNFKLNSNNKGGLNIGSLKAANLALLCKWWWRFKTGPESLWKEVIKAFYGDNGGLGEELPANRRTSTWGIVCNLDRDLAKVGIDINRLLFFDMQPDLLELGP